MKKVCKLFEKCQNRVDETQLLKKVPNRVDGSAVCETYRQKVVNRVDESEVFQKKSKPRARDARRTVGGTPPRTGSKAVGVLNL